MFLALAVAGETDAEEAVLSVAARALRTKARSQSSSMYWIVTQVGRRRGLLFPRWAGSECRRLRAVLSNDGGGEDGKMEGKEREEETGREERGEGEKKSERKGEREEGGESEKKGENWLTAFRERLVSWSICSSP